MLPHLYCCFISLLRFNDYSRWNFQQSVPRNFSSANEIFSDAFVGTCSNRLETAFRLNTVDSSSHLKLTMFIPYKCFMSKLRYGSSGLFLWFPNSAVNLSLSVLKLDSPFIEHRETCIRVQYTTSGCLYSKPVSSR